MPSLTELAPLAWILLAISATLVGVAKTSIPGVASISIALFATTLPAKASTGALLLVLLVGDVFALLNYRRHADWSMLLRLLPSVVVGIAIGALFLAFASDQGVRRTIGVILLLLILLTLWLRRDRTSRLSTRGEQAARIGYGALGGFSTMVANAGGPVISMYFLLARFDVLAFLGTASWFFAVVNLGKLPIAIGLGLITWDTVLLMLILVPTVAIGAFVGRRITSIIKQRVFDWVIVAGTVLGSVYLIVS